VPAMRAGIRYAWAPAWRGAVRVVLGGLGSLARLSQLRTWLTEWASGRRQANRRCAVLVRHLEGTALSAGKGKHVMETADHDDDLDQYDMFILLLDEINPAAASWIDEVIQAVTVHEPEGLVQFIVTEEAWGVLHKNLDIRRAIEDAAAAVMPDCELHFTYPVEVVA
jgi:hypothetical protein